MDQVGKSRERRKVTQLANTGNPDRVSLYVDSVCSAPLGPRSTFNNCAVDQLFPKEVSIDGTYETSVEDPRKGRL